MKANIVLLLVLMPLILGGVNQAEYVVRSSIDTEYNSRISYMDTDSTFCMYSWNFYPAPNQQLKIKRLHSNGTADEEQVIYDFNSAMGFHTHIQSITVPDGYLLIFSSASEVVALTVFGDYVQARTHSTAFAGSPSYLRDFCTIGDNIFFLAHDINQEFNLWKWDTSSDSISSIFAWSPLDYSPVLSAFGNRLVLSSEFPFLNQDPMIVFDSSLVPEFHQTNIHKVRCSYSFDENTFFATWNESAELACDGVVYLVDDELDFDPWSDNWWLEEWYTIYDVNCRFPNNIFGATYTFMTAYYTVHHFDLYQRTPPSHFVLYTGFPEVNDFQESLAYVGNMQDRLLMINHSNGSFTFRLADFASSEWINFPQGSWSPQIDGGQIANVQAYNSQNHILIHLTSDSVNRYYFLQLNLSVSSDDPINQPNTMIAYPNPFKDSIRISFKDTSKRSGMDIYNLRGQKVRSIASSANAYEWDGKDDQGKNLGAGVYFGRETNGKQTIKLLRLSH